MVRYHRLIGRLLVPLIAIAYASHMLWEHLAKGFRPMLLNYALILIVPVLFFGAFTIFREVLIYRREAHELNDSATTAKDDGWQSPAAALGKLVRPALVLAIGVAFVLLLPILGWALSFALLAISLLLVMGERKPLLLVVMTLGCLAFVYGLFVLVLGLELPAGILLPR
jgi:divalent metal cation (Fe/Co/Zn/Cd) transporter